MNKPEVEKLLKKYKDGLCTEQEKALVESWHLLELSEKKSDLKLDEIIDFSGCERYIDTPVKRYSSGMTVRLAFAVAAFLEPEILVIDEVLAVGDAEFQKKAIGKMQDISQGEGRTVLFVSHNMAAVKQLCTRGIVMELGKVKYDGNIDTALSRYLEINSAEENLCKIIYEEDTSKEAQILEVELRDKNNERMIEYFADQDIYIHITLRNNFYQENARLNFSILDKYENVIFINRRVLDFVGLIKWIVKIPGNSLIANSYMIGFALDIPKIKLLDLPQKKLNLNIINLIQEEFKEGDTENGIFKIPVKWEI